MVVVFSISQHVADIFGHEEGRVLEVNDLFLEVARDSANLFLIFIEEGNSLCCWLVPYQLLLVHLRRDTVIY